MNTVCAISCKLALLWAGVVHANGLAIGDSLAVGFGPASGMHTIAKVGIGSCRIAGMVPAQHYDFVLISAGTNHAPGPCVEEVRQRVAELVQPTRVMWVLPVNGARGHVAEVAARYGDAVFSYAPSRSNWPHPSHYFSVFSK